MRLVVGYTFMLAGWGKLNNLAQVTENFIGWGIPFPTNIDPVRVWRRIFRRGDADPRPVHANPGRDAGGGHGRRHQVGEMGRRQFTGDAARLRGSGLLRPASCGSPSQVPALRHWTGCW